MHPYTPKPLHVVTDDERKSKGIYYNRVNNEFTKICNKST